MKILSLDTKKNHAKVVPENLDDLWVISELLKEGDIVGMRSLRKVKLSLGDRTEAEKKPMFLKISVTSTKFQEFNSNLRISGVIVEGPENIKGSHTFSLEEQKKIEIWKEFSALDVSMLKEAKKKKADVAFVLIDRDDALIAHGGERLWIKSGIASKRSQEDEDYKQFFGQIKARLKELNPEYVVVAGPGFVKDKLSEVIEQKHVNEGASSVSESGIREVISRGALEKVGAVVREAEEQLAVDSVFSNIHSGKSFYGIDETKALVDANNIQTLIVSANLISKSVKENKYRALRELIERVKYAKGKIILVGRNKDATSRLDGLGGIAGLKRW